MANLIIISGLVGFVVYKIIKTLLGGGYKSHKTEINNYTTEQHLHINDSKDLKN